MNDKYEEEEWEEITPTWDAGSMVMNRYRLEKRIGKGGMGDVWLATDEIMDQEVAVKFLVGEIDGDARHRFAAEVRAMARLDHPHIVSVLDQGDFDNAPLFVMTLLQGTPLGKWLRPAHWEHVCLVFDQVLDALAYAHARGLIHRDLKPSNIMVTGTADHPHAVVLDFGIAIDPWSDGLITGEIVGSPGYMAPEQRRGETWRAREPTDLYAFGVLLYESLSGRSPFGKGAKRPESLDSPSFLFPRAKFPIAPRRGFDKIGMALEPLIRKLLAFRISDRPLLASDVREELARSVERVKQEEGVTPWEEEPTHDLGERTEILSPWHPVYLAPRAPTTKLPPGSYGLYGLRQPPVLGRDAELGHLWKASRRAFASGKPGVVFLEGINGIGKSHLALHLCERANEQGLARFLEVSYLPQTPGASGLVAALEQVMRLRHAEDRESASGRLEAWLSDEDAHSDTLAEALLGLLRPADGHGHIGPALKSTLFLSVLRALSKHRAVVVVIHDVQWCEDESFLYLLDELSGQEGLPVLVVATVRVDEQHESFVHEYPSLLERPRVSRVTLGPLPEGAVRSLLRSNVALESELENALVERSEGLPLLASQLLDELFRDHALEDGPSGARLKPDRQLATVSTGFRSFWSNRIERIAAADADGPYWVDALQGLALARVGLTRTVLKSAGAASGEPLDDAVAAWEREGLLIQGPDRRVRFCHSELAREVAAQVAPEAAVRWNIIWSAALGRLDEDKHGRYGLERGLHLLDADEPKEAISALLASAEQAHNWGDIYRAETAAAAAEELATKLDNPIRLAWALRWRGGAALAAGKIDEAERLLNTARKTFEQERVLVGLGATLDALGWSRISRAAYEAAVELCTYGAEAYRRARDETGLASILGTLGLALARLERYGEARTVLNEAEETSRRSGDDRALARALQGQAECARYEGELERAELAYTKALEIAEREWRAAVPALQDGLGLVALARGDYVQAIELLNRALDVAKLEGQKRLQVLYSADLAAAALLSGDSGTTTMALERTEKGLESLDRVDEHMQWSLERALTTTTSANHPELVLRVGELVAQLWDRLDRSDEAARVRYHLESLGLV